MNKLCFYEARESFYFLNVKRNYLKYLNGKEYAYMWSPNIFKDALISKLGIYVNLYFNLGKKDKNEIWRQIQD